MKNPVIEFTSWNRHATNGRAIFADSNTPQATPNDAFINMARVSVLTSNPINSDAIRTARRKSAKKFMHQQKSR